MPRMSLASSFSSSPRCAWVRLSFASWDSEINGVEGSITQTDTITKHWLAYGNIRIMYMYCCGLAWSADLVETCPTVIYDGAVVVLIHFNTAAALQLNDRAQRL